MVTLFSPFRNKLVGIPKRLKFNEIYTREQKRIISNRKEYESNIGIDTFMDELSKLCEVKLTIIKKSFEINEFKRERYVHTVTK